MHTPEKGRSATLRTGVNSVSHSRITRVSHQSHRSNPASNKEESIVIPILLDRGLDYDSIQRRAFGRGLLPCRRSGCGSAAAGTPNHPWRTIFHDVNEWNPRGRRAKGVLNCNGLSWGGRSEPRRTHACSDISNRFACMFAPHVRDGTLIDRS